MMGIEFVTDKKTRTPFDAESNIGVLIAQQAQARGLIVRPLGSMAVLSPCLTLSEGNINDIVDILDQSIAAVIKTL